MRRAPSYLEQAEQARKLMGRALEVMDELKKNVDPNIEVIPGLHEEYIVVVPDGKMAEVERYMRDMVGCRDGGLRRDGVSGDGNSPAKS